MGVYLTEKTAVAYIKRLLTIDDYGDSFAEGSVGAITNGIRGVVYFKGDISNVRGKIFNWMKQKNWEDYVDEECNHYFDQGDLNGKS